MIGGVESRRGSFREATGAVKAEAVPAEWADSCISTHLRGIGKLLARSRDALLKSLARELEKIDGELGTAAENREDWVAAWRKRAPALERVWDGVDARCVEFRTHRPDISAIGRRWTNGSPPSKNWA